MKWAISAAHAGSRMKRLLALLLLAPSLLAAQKKDSMRVVFVCEHGTVWDGLPSVTANYTEASKAIAARVTRLVDSLALARKTKR